MDEPTGLEALAAFLPVFESPDFVFGHWEQPPPDEDGTMHFPYFVLNPDAERFMGTVGFHGWVLRGFDWIAWNATDEGIALRTAEGLSNATPQQLAQLLTALVRQDRFVEGALGQAYDEGLLDENRYPSRHAGWRLTGRSNVLVQVEHVLRVVAILDGDKAIVGRGTERSPNLLDRKVVDRVDV